MSVFISYYKNGELISFSFEDVRKLHSEKNKNALAEIAYQRIYSRILKPITFFDERHCGPISKEYKSGFLTMICCLVSVEILASFIQGNDKTQMGKGKESFNKVFEYAKAKGNELGIFYETDIYKNIRNGLLHQGETYDKFLIRRKGPLYDMSSKAINANLFFKDFIILLDIYRIDLEKSELNSDIVSNMMDKISHILNKESF